jgi:hypothetical protein
MDDSEIDQLFVEATVDALIEAVLDPGPETPAAFQLLIESGLNAGGEAQMLAVAVGLARAAGPDAAAAWLHAAQLMNFDNPRIGAEARSEVRAYADLLTALYGHAVHGDVSFSGVWDRWEDGGPPAQVAAVHDLMFMAAKTRQDGWR